MAKGKKPPLTDDAVNKERQKLYTAAGGFMHAWADLEETLCALFCAASAAHPFMGTATFYSLQSIEAELRVITNLLEARCQPGHPWADAVKACWVKVRGGIDRRKDMRNIIAHGKPARVGLLGGREIFVWGPQPQDVLGMARFMQAERIDTSRPFQLKGYSPNEIDTSAKAADEARRALRELAQIIGYMGSTRPDHIQAWREALPPLAVALGIDSSRLTTPSAEELPPPLQPSLG